MTLFRSIWRSGLLLGLLLAACIDGQWRKLFRGLRPGPDGAVWVHHWCRRIMWVLGLQCRVQGHLPIANQRGLAMVSNHLTYLDILTYSSLTPFVMVAKTEVRGWPLIGWITAQAGTVYVQRADVKGGQTQTHAEVNALMANAFRSGLPVLFYPEGTTTDGESVLPFRRGLFNSVVHDDVPVQAAAIHYSLQESNPGASIAQDVCYWGDMEFVPHLFHCLGLKGLTTVVTFDTEAVKGNDRFELALNSHDRVKELYGECMQAAASGSRIDAGERGPAGASLQSIS